MAATTSGYSSTPGSVGGLHHGGSVASSLNSCSSNLGFAIPTGNGAEDSCNMALAGLFQQIMNDMKGSGVVWEDFLAKSSRLHGALKSTLVASSAFLDAFQRVADVATNTRGASKEIGKCLTRMVLRQRSIEAKMKAFASALMDCVVIPLQDKMEDWKKTCLCMDKEHGKEYKRYRQEIKKRSTDTVRLQKKAKKAGPGSTKSSMYGGGGSSKAMDSFNDLVELKRQLQDKEYEAVRAAMIEERSRFCMFVTCLKPFLDEELGMLGEMVHLEELTDSLVQHSADPYQLPPASVQALADVRATCSLSGTSCAAELVMQDHLGANDTYYSSSCSSGSNQWGNNYRSPPSSPLPDDSASARNTKLSAASANNQDHDGGFRERGEFAVLGQRQRSVCSMSNASTASSYASSDISSSSYGGLNHLDRTLTAANKTYRRCFSDNNGQSEQHYYPASITSSIAEREGEVSEDDDSGNNDTLLPASHKGKGRARRSSLSQSEDFSRRHPMSLAIRNEYYSTIRFSSISSGDSGFISHPDQINGGNSGEPTDGPDSLLTPTVNGSPWSPPSKVLQDGPGTGQRPPAVPPFNAVAQADSRPHTIAHNGYSGVNPAHQDGLAYQTANLRQPKRPPLLPDTFLPPAQQRNGESQAAQSKDFRRTYQPTGTPPPPPPRAEETIYANANLLSDAAALPPPPDNWMDHTTAAGNGMAHSRPNSVNLSGHEVSRASHDHSAYNHANEMSVSMTIRRAKDRKDDPRWNTQAVDVAAVRQAAAESAPGEVVLRRRETLVDRSQRRLSQQIYGVPSNSVSRPPPPPLPIRRTPSLHQNIQEADGNLLVGEMPTSFTATAVRRATEQPSETVNQTGHPRSFETRPRPVDSHTSVIQSLQERLRIGPTRLTKHESPSSSTSLPISAWTKAPATGTPKSAPPQLTNSSHSHGSFSRPGPSLSAPVSDPRSGILTDIRRGAFALRKVNPDQLRDRSAPLVRK